MGQFETLLRRVGQFAAVNGNALTSIAFGFVQRRIGIAHDLLEAAGFAKLINSDAGVDIQRLAGEGEGRIQAAQQFLCQIYRQTFELTAFKHQAELITAEACQRDAAFQLIQEAFSDHFEQGVSGVVTEAFIDQFEVVDVDDQYRAATLQALGAGQCMLYALTEQ